jgi:hypothetical protein
MYRVLLLRIPLALISAGCTSVTPQGYVDQRPQLDMVRYLTGHTYAWVWRSRVPARW